MLDERQTYRGRHEADVALLVRRVREACQANDLRCIGTSATLAPAGTLGEQQREVARVASLLFGTEVKAGSVLDRRMTMSKSARTERASATVAVAPAVPLSPPLTAWAATQYFGPALATDALKLSATQVVGLPALNPSPVCATGADTARSAMESTGGDAWCSSLIELGEFICEAFGLNDRSKHDVFEGWQKRLPKWR